LLSLDAVFAATPEAAAALAFLVAVCFFVVFGFVAAAEEFDEDEDVLPPVNGWLCTELWVGVDLWVAAGVAGAECVVFG
jgi:hypothetical protein